MIANSDPGKHPFWLSWYSSGNFTLDHPWWVSGYRIVDSGATEDSIVAAVMATSDADAMDQIRAAHDNDPKACEPLWRFVIQKPDGWSPFSERFPRADWMVWP
jgi:hypothetical protein